jgi:hypothetical protein
MNSTDPQTVIETIEAAMSDYSLDQLLDIIRTIEAEIIRNPDARKTVSDQRIIRIAAHGVIEARYPQMVPDLEARIDEDLTYTDLVVDVLRNLNIIN